MKKDIFKTIRYLILLPLWITFSPMVLLVCFLIAEDWDEFIDYIELFYKIPE